MRSESELSARTGGREREGKIRDNIEKEGGGGGGKEKRKNEYKKKN